MGETSTITWCSRHGPHFCASHSLSRRAVARHSVAIGSYLSGALVYAVGAYTTGVAGAKHGWLPNDLNEGRVDLFFLLLGGEALAQKAGARKLAFGRRH